MVFLPESSCFFFFPSFLGQTSAQFVPKAVPSLESEGSEGAYCSPSLYFLLPTLYFFGSHLSSLSSILLPCLFLLWRNPVSFPSFSNFAKISSPFLQRAMCSFTESSEKSEGQEEEALPQGADTCSLTFSYFLNFIYFLFFFPILTLSAFARADIGAKDLKPVVIEVVMESVPNV